MKEIDPRTYADSVPVYCVHDELLEIEKIIPNPRNPNQHSEDQIKLLAKIINAQGWRAPITISMRSGFIVRGHGRLLSAIYNNATVVPVDYQNYRNEAEEWADLIADNRLAELSEIDNSMLVELLRELDAAEFPIDLSGFSMDEFKNVLESLDENDSFDDDFDFEEEVKKADNPESELGDIYILDGKHRVMCGDSTSPENVELLMNGREARLIVTDPPYNVNYEGAAGTIKNDNMSEAAFENFLTAAFNNMAAAAAPGAAAYLFHPDGGGSIFRKTFVAAGFLLKQCLIWKKNQFVLSRQDYHWIHEPILYGWKAGAAHYFTDERFHSTFLEGKSDKSLVGLSAEELLTYIRELEEYIKQRQSMIEENKPLKSEDHPTMKPIPLLAKLIFNSSKLNWIVLDLFGGAGSTLIAADQLHRICYLMECESKFCDVIIKRYCQYKQKEEQKVNVVRIRHGKEEPWYPSEGGVA